MEITERITSPRTPGAAPSPPATSGWLAEIAPLIEVIPGYGPPAVVLAGPLLLFALVLAGPFALVVTLAAVSIAVTAAVALAGAVLASPYLLVRHLRARRAVHAPRGLPAAPVAPLRLERAAA